MEKALQKFCESAESVKDHVFSKREIFLNKKKYESTFIIPFDNRGITRELLRKEDVRQA